MSSPPPRQISIRGEVYVKLKTYCDARGVTMASLVESLLNDVTGDVKKPQRKRRRRVVS